MTKQSRDSSDARALAFDGSERAATTGPLANAASTTHGEISTGEDLLPGGIDGTSGGDEPIVLTVSRVLHGYRWWQQEDDTIEVLIEKLQVMATERGLRVQELLPAVTAVAETGVWARITQTATARPA